jgi:hypothetical protein
MNVFGQFEFLDHTFHAALNGRGIHGAFRRGSALVIASVGGK